MAEESKINKKLQSNQRKIDIGRVSKFILGVFLIYFILFGYVCNVFNKGPGENLLFIYKSFFNPFIKVEFDLTFESDLSYPSWVSLIIFLVIEIFVAYLEDFLIYSIRNSIWYIPFILVFSWIWYAINYGISIWLVLAEYFTSWNGYLNILILLGLSLGASILGGFLKSLHFAQLKKQNREIIQSYLSEAKE